MKRETGERIDLTIPFKLIGVSKDIGIKTKAAPKEELAYGQIDVVVSNSGEDRHGERIIMEGISDVQIKRNPVVLWAHDYSGLPIGKIVKIWKEDGNKMARIEFAVNEYPFAATAYKLVGGGFINAVSIGGIVREWNEDYTVIKQLEWVELSVVPVGAHPDALVVGKSYKKDLKIKRVDIEKQYAEFKEKSDLLDKVKDLPENKRNSYVEVLKEILGLLEKTELKSEELKEVEEKKEVKEEKTTFRIILSK